MGTPYNLVIGSRAPAARGWKLLLVAVLLMMAAAPVGGAGASSAQQETVAQVDEAQSRYLVVENVGQFAAEARFMIERGDQRIWLTEDAVWLVVADPARPRKPGTLATALARPPRRPVASARGGTALRFSFAGSQTAVLEPFGRLDTQVSFLVGNDPARWQSAVPAWSGVRYRDIYPGIDLVVGGSAAGVVPWRLEARSGADTSAVALRVEGASPAVGAAGEFVFQLAGRSVSVELPGWAPDGATAAESAAVQGQDANTFALVPQSGSDAPQAAPEAVTDLVYSRVLGGASTGGGGIAVDPAGNAYVAGTTSAANFPGVAGHYDASFGGLTDAFVAKLDPTAEQIVYATYLGGSGADTGAGIAVANGVAYVTGATDSTNFPGTSGTAGGLDAFAVALGANGNSLGYARLLGGAAGDDKGAAIAVDGTDAYIAGTAGSWNLPGQACGAIVSGSTDVLVARISATGVPVYTMCLGGTGDDRGYGVAVANQVAYVTGETWSADIVYPQPTPAGENDVLVAAIGADGTTRGVTLIGGGLGDMGNSIAARVDGSGNGSLYIAGTSNSNDLALATAREANRYDADAVIARVAVAPGAAGSIQLTHNFATYLGGAGDDAGRGIAIEVAQVLYVAGATASTNFPVSSEAYDASNSDATTDAFVARMDLSIADPDKVTYATYLGGAGEDAAEAVAADGSGNAFVGGSTAGGDFPVLVGAAPTGDEQSFAAKLAVAPLAAPVIEIEAGGNDIVLTWLPAAGSTGYDAFRSVLPYFMPGDQGATLLPDPTTSPYTDGSVLTQAGPYFYVVRSIGATAGQFSSVSNRVGKFTFELVRGD